MRLPGKGTNLSTEAAGGLLQGGDAHLEAGVIRLQTAHLTLQGVINLHNKHFGQVPLFAD